MKNMKLALIVSAAMSVALVAAGGCAKKNGGAKAAKDGSVLDVQPLPMDAAPVAAAPAEQPQFEPVPAVTETPAAPAAAAGGQYTVKKGDTLFGIARAHYGTGRDWQRIASANPGLTPQTLKAGQTIVVP